MSRPARRHYRRSEVWNASWASSNEWNTAPMCSVDFISPWVSRDVLVKGLTRKETRRFRLAVSDLGLIEQEVLLGGRWQPVHLT
jgi:hypothetical protein